MLKFSCCFHTFFLFIFNINACFALFCSFYFSITDNYRIFIAVFLFLLKIIATAKNLTLFCIKFCWQFIYLFVHLEIQNSNQIALLSHCYVSVSPSFRLVVKYLLCFNLIYWLLSKIAENSIYECKNKKIKSKQLPFDIHMYN